MKGILLAGGAGKRFYPITEIYSKQLITIYDKPLIYYPLSILMLAEIKEILIISDAKTIPSFRSLLGDGTKFGISIEYAVQERPNGIAEAFIIGEEFIGDDSVTLILGDNIFYGKLDFLRNAINENEGATIFGYFVKDPEKYGVVEFNPDGEVISLEEKPAHPKSNYAVPGLYVYNNDVIDIAKNLNPSARGELEITDVNKTYLKRKSLKVTLLGRGIAWLDSGTPQSLMDSSNFISLIEQRQNLKIACLEEIAYRKKFIDREKLVQIIKGIPKSSYQEYLLRILNDV